MNSQPAIEPGGSKAERTRAIILAAAEAQFAQFGFAATRIEDVAAAVGMTRAGLFYYYRDKQALFDATVAQAFDSLAYRLESALVPENGTVAQRIELAAGAWIDEIVSRPTLARLILRFVADGADQLTHGVFSDNNRLPMKFWALFEEGRANGELRPTQDDPFHIASAVIGTSVFYVAALAALVPHGQFEPLDPQQVAAHKRGVIDSTRRLLGITGNKSR